MCAELTLIGLRSLGGTRRVCFVWLTFLTQTYGWNLCAAGFRKAALASRLPLTDWTRYRSRGEAWIITDNRGPRSTQGWHQDLVKDAATSPTLGGNIVPTEQGVLSQKCPSSSSHITLGNCLLSQSSEEMPKALILRLDRGMAKGSLHKYTRASGSIQIWRCLQCAWLLE
jgi:hypothetical protein